MPDLTIAIACGPFHKDIVKRAVESCEKQTARVSYGVWPDEQARGTGWARNQLLSRVTTPFVTFLDADDYLESDFAARMLEAAYENTSRYVYCGWLADEMGANGKPQPISPPDKCYCFENGCLVHPVTALVPTAWAREVGGFDENLPGMEDTDFFLKLTSAGHCGYRLDLPLFHWTPATEKSRSFIFRNRPDYLEIKRRIGDKYNKGLSMPCCGGKSQKNEGPFGEKQPGDILAHMLGTPSLGGYVGYRTRRIYPGVGYGDLVWAHPADVAADPRKFAPAEPPAAPQVIVSTTVQASSEPPAISTAEQLASVMQGYAREGNDVYLPQNAAPQSPAARMKPSQIRKLAGY